MSQRVWKFPLPTASSLLIDVPAESQFLSIQIQDELPCMWRLVNDSTLPARQVFIQCFGTGHLMPDVGSGRRRTFLGTVQLSTGLVFHYFELKDV
jgi:hypothetical protein